MNTKNMRIKANTVTDEQGRQRFHGAFTGGFSAGYFNTVGSAEGFTPAQFVSSRSNRAAKVAKSVTDFMDAEDGLLNGHLSTKDNLDTFAVLPSTSRETDPLMAKLKEHFVLEPTNTIGTKLLNQLGWKPGMAIGPRKKKQNYFQDPEIAKLILENGKLPKSSLENGTITFSDRYDGSLLPAKIPAWPGTQGLGYDPRKDSSRKSLRDSLMEEDESLGDDSREMSSNRYQISDLFKKTDHRPPIGQRGGSSKYSVPKAAVYLDDDDDIAFGHDDKSGDYYGVEEQDGEGVPGSRRLGGSSQRHEDLAGRHAIPSTSAERCPTDDRPVLPGFVLARQTKADFPVYPPPTVPRDFRPRPELIFRKASMDKETTIQQQRDPTKKFELRKDALEGSVASSSSKTGEPSATVPSEPSGKPSSVFDLLKPADRERILKLAKRTQETTTPSLSTISSTVEKEAPTAALPSSSSSSSSSSSEAARPMLVSQTLLQHSAFTSLAETFKSRFTAASEATIRSQQQDQAVTQLQAGMRTAGDFKATLQEKLPEAAAIVTPSTQLPVCTPRRIEIAWHPSSLLSKRMRIKNSGNHTGGGEAPNKDLDLKASAVEAPALPRPEKSVAEKAKSREQEDQRPLTESEKAEFLKHDVYLQPVERPPTSVFRSIFEDSDESDDDEDDDDDGDGDDDDDDAGDAEDNQNKDGDVDTGSTRQTNNASSHDNRHENLTKPSFALPLPAPSQRPMDNSAAKVSLAKYRGDESHGDDEIGSVDAVTVPAPAVDKTTAALPTFVPRAQRLAGSSGVSSFPLAKRPPVRAVMISHEADDDNSRAKDDDDDEDGETPKITLKRRLPTNTAVMSGGIRVGGVSIAGTMNNTIRLPPQKKRIVVSAWQDEEDEDDGPM